MVAKRSRKQKWNRKTVGPIVVAAACLAGCSQKAQSYGPGHQLTDDAIAAYAMKFRQERFREEVGQTQIIGLHNGLRVVADVLYLDDSQTTLGVIHYAVDPGEACKRARGALRLELVPAPMAATQELYCVPKVLVYRDIRMELAD